jgi:hypothetical protein
VQQVVTLDGIELCPSSVNPAVTFSTKYAAPPRPAYGSPRTDIHRNTYKTVSSYGTEWGARIVYYSDFVLRAGRPWNPNSVPNNGNGFFSSQKLRGPSSFLFYGRRDNLSPGRSVKLVIDLRLISSVKNEWEIDFTFPYVAMSFTETTFKFAFINPYPANVENMVSS